MSVNDLIEKWGGQADDFGVCSANLEELARTAWHPVSKPPTEEDGDHLGEVAIWWIEEEIFETMNYTVVAQIKPNLLWARISDVVLFPMRDSYE